MKRFFNRKHFEKRTVDSPWNSDGANRILAWDRTSHGCCVLCWGRLDVILFSSSLPSLFPPSISSAIFFLSASSFSVFPSLLSFLLFLFLSYTQCISHLCPSLLSIPPSSASRARTRRAFRKRLSHVHAFV